MARPGVRLAVLTCALLGSPAAAGDRALLDLIGYSADGRYFAFEEYGVQDGSGFPYSNVYIVDLPTDRWVPGTPFRVRLEADDADLAAARTEAQQAAAETLDELQIEAPAYLIALNGDGEPGDGLTLDFGAVGYFPGELRGENRLRLEIFTADTPDDCVAYLGEPAKGFALIFEEGDDERDLHRDGDLLPRSRGCPTTYRIYGVAARPDTGSLEGAVAIISVYPFGFEGPDRRFLAVPLGQ